MSNPAGPINRVLESFRRLVPEDKSAVIACSGGADSMALLFCAQKTGRTLIAAHVLHDMRPYDEASKDRDLVQSYCESNAIHFVDKVAKLRFGEKIPTEEAYGYERQRLLWGVADEYNGYVVTAHHADDQLETMLMKLCRGSGLRGLSGISETHNHNDNITVRPMLSISKDDVYEICRQNNVPFNEDQTNKDTKYTRNAIRHNVIPALKALFPHCSEKANDAAAIFSQAQELANESLYDLKLHQKTNIVYDPDWGGGGTCVSLPIEALQLANNITIYEWLRSSVVYLAGGFEYVAHDSVNKEMVDKVILAIRNRSKRTFDWPLNIKVSVSKTEVTVMIVKKILP